MHFTMQHTRYTALKKASVVYDTRDRLQSVHNPRVYNTTLRTTGGGSAMMIIFFSTKNSRNDDSDEQL